MRNAPLVTREKPSICFHLALRKSLGLTHSSSMRLFQCIITIASFVAYRRLVFVILDITPRKPIFSNKRMRLLLGQTRINNKRNHCRKVGAIYARILGVLFAAFFTQSCCAALSFGGLIDSVGKLPVVMEFCWLFGPDTSLMSFVLDSTWLMRRKFH